MKLLLFLSFIQQIKSHGTPSFFDSSQQSYKLSQIDPRINADTTIESHNNNSTYRGDYDFFYCTATVKNSNFTQCFAFGSNIAGPNGGAMYFFGSAVNIQLSHFEQNEAADGGALCFIQSNVYLGGNTANKFDSNKAYCAGGAILFEGNYYKTNPENYINKLYIFNYNFTNNQAYQTGGALQIELQSNAYLEGVTMESNKAADNGGAIYAKDTDLSIFRSYILKNQAGDKLTVGAASGNNSVSSSCKIRNYSEKQVTKFNTSSLNFNETYSLHFAGRGCAGIAFLSSFDRTESKPFQLITQNTCFLKNHMISGIINTLNSTNHMNESRGYDIMLENSVKWDSLEDYFSDSSKAWVYIGKTPKEFHPYNSKKPNSDGECHTEGSDGDGETPNLFDITPVNPATRNTGDDKKVSDLPTPTKYTYQATPITRLPKATTKSHTRTITPSDPSMWSSLVLTIHPIQTISIPRRTVPPKLTVQTLRPPVNISLNKDDPRYTVTKTITKTDSYSEIDTLVYNLTDFEYPIYSTKYSSIVQVDTEIEVNSLAPNVEGTQSKVVTTSYVNVSTTLIVPSLSETDTMTNTTTTEKESTTHTMKSTKTLTETLVKINTFTLSSTLVETLIIVPVEDQTRKDNKSPTTIIIWSVIGCIAVFCLAVIGLFLYRKTHSESSTSGSESLDDDDVFGDETKFSSQIIEFTQEDDSNMLSTFNGEPEIQEAPDEDEVFLNGEF